MLKLIKYTVILFSIFIFLIYINKNIKWNYKISDYNHNNQLPFLLKESYQTYINDPCKNSNTVTSIRSCYQEYLKGKQNYIDNLEKSTNGIIEENTRDIKTIQTRLNNINDNINEYQEDIDENIINIQNIQNDMYKMINNTTELIKNAENAKNKIQQESEQFQ